VESIRATIREFASNPLLAKSFFLSGKIGNRRLKKCGSGGKVPPKGAEIGRVIGDDSVFHVEQSGSEAFRRLFGVLALRRSTWNIAVRSTEGNPTSPGALESNL
jgi:hypothetical protein